MRRERHHGGIGHALSVEAIAQAAQNLGHYLLMAQVNAVKIAQRYICRGFSRLERRGNPHALHSDIKPERKALCLFNPASFRRQRSPLTLL
jgi:hypothetical protein